MTRLVICDIDNTLVLKHTQVSERTIRDIKALREKGILFGLASGRNIIQLHELEDQWGIHSDMLVGLNGSELYDGLTDTKERFYEMEPEWIKECFEIMAPFKTNPTVFYDDVTYVGEISETVRKSAKFMKDAKLPHVVKDYSEFWAKKAPKVCFRVDAADMPAIEAAVAAHPSDKWAGFKTEYIMFEFCHIKASKGEIMKKFCERHQIPMEEVMAFGDMTNDISMLKAAGTGVCMRSGSEDAKAVSDLITDKGVEEDGWADFVEKHLLA